MTRKNMTGLAVGVGLAVAAACTVAGTTYYPAEDGYVLDNDGRIYSYVVYGTNDVATPVVAGMSGVSTEGRAATPLTQSSGTENYDGTSPYSPDSASPTEPTVSVKAPDVNEVFGRA
jgi:hypothetical protein